MQVTEHVATGLKRELSVVIGKGELDRRFVDRLNSVKPNVEFKGFRKGKVPESHIEEALWPLDHGARCCRRRSTRPAARPSPIATNARQSSRRST